MSESFSEFVSESDPEPEPTGHWQYVDNVIQLSRQTDSSGRYSEWTTNSGDSQITLQPKRIRACLAGQAFNNYAHFSVEDKHRLESMTLKVMSSLDGNDKESDIRVLINYVPLLFAHNVNELVGRRERDGSDIEFQSDRIHIPHRREMLVGGLATILYYTDFPSQLQHVE